MNFKVTLKESQEEECKIPYQFLQKTDLLSLLEFCCIMEIKINDKIFFCEGICPLEFRFQFNSWFNKAFDKQSFYYISEDDSNNPVLEFNYSNGKWKVYSIFQKFDCGDDFLIEDIITFFNQFNNELKKLIIS